MRLHIIEETEREGIEINDFSMDTEVAFDARCNAHTKLKQLFREKRGCSKRQWTPFHLVSLRTARPTCVDGQTQIDCSWRNALTTQSSSVNLIQLSRSEGITRKKLSFRATLTGASCELEQEMMTMLHPFMDLAGVKQYAMITMTKDKVVRV